MLTSIDAAQPQLLYGRSPWAWLPEGMYARFDGRTHFLPVNQQGMRSDRVQEFLLCFVGSSNWRIVWLDNYLLGTSDEWYCNSNEINYRRHRKFSK